ncbi:hypothetical protein NM688_g5525 [Phlebia brevispora]|uniref:Uncharacterized protein n=1 Tax=Phlebia brevispora TaxID=194682 RepID=A0ACC1SUG0_9APHY|nr:hypothetical protein NM688_g5525 [Phlebia brevispora]
MSELKLSQFKALVFDVYATLIDWENGIYDALQPLLKRIDPSLATSKPEVLLAFDSVQTDLQTKYPKMLYSDILAHTHAELATRLANKPSRTGASVSTTAATEQSTGTRIEPHVTAAGPSSSAETTILASEGLTKEDIAFGKSIAKWRPFPDTIPALCTLSKHYKLTVLSNVDRQSFSGTREVLERSDPAHQFTFDAIYTAQDIGSYKPNLANFEYALKNLHDSFGVEKDQVLIVAAALDYDHRPANKLGIRSVFIDRAGAALGQDGDAKYNWRFPTLGDMAEAVEKEA